MNLENSKKNLLVFLFTYLVNLGFACYFSKAVKTVYPSYLLVLILGIGGLFSGFLLSSFSKKEESRLSTFVFAAFQLFQGLIGFAIAYFLFHLSFKESFIFPIGATLGLLIWYVLSLDLSFSISSIFLAVFVAIGLALTLRLKGVWGGLCYGFVLLNSFGFVFKSWSRSESTREFFFRAILCGSVLAIGRAVIQYYLVQTSYDSLGIVITHPYTFVALFIGILTPMVFGAIQKEKAMNFYWQLVLFGIFLPFLLGVFLHVRPFAAYLFGLVISGYMTGLRVVESDFVQPVMFLNFAVAIFSIPVFQELSYFSRSNRLMLLTAVFAVFIIFCLFIKLFQRKNETLQTT